MHMGSSLLISGSTHPCSTTLPAVNCEERLISFCSVVVGEEEKHHSSRSSSSSKNYMGGIGDIAFKSLTAALGLTTIYLTATFSFNVYRGLAWHNAQTKADKEEANDQN